MVITDKRTGGIRRGKSREVEGVKTFLLSCSVCHSHPGGQSGEAGLLYWVLGSSPWKDESHEWSDQTLTCSRSYGPCRLYTHKEQVNVSVSDDCEIRSQRIGSFMSARYENRPVDGWKWWRTENRSERFVRFLPVVFTLSSTGAGNVIYGRFNIWNCVNVQENKSQTLFY